ncbi:hypothetical protein COW36_02095 [bacterium (Candidatus Blackallbacteria) CG17_big_fil_post_rev_8_21_14_2_50_48_46]|uniref:Flagellar hook-associated protein 2 n=1 Tax=bacterium (Candidatus Blackallbacteria) CG17_big_fil_post_rev_8_21_14_2_50_48_46 TaxID=2014261 RepID=A0A2M7GAU6_9BACT|nr:MAG: hypothetical protein COW64_26485 [bacterium (Candidatus Blackallbacteria) CG18_big_fil_WC_8_21_14_2_50_49_26]PIW19225.1 MAG: hypothetical protein COW36_02095 [bacterium (Candidatus Blackallbacteria) CG17_big_fil_post_rev_8_21_14_2_50_48_46]PIW45425.1 MAG: hypothetical protein COW20_20045 [bacterium (Candidatus Blackallbacteria) CG13_big_fil_rev_8_21_14_2_50_49_14]
MSTISFGGLASGLNTDSIIQQLLAIESRPLTLLSQQRSNYQNQIDAYKDINTRLSALENKAFALTQISSLIGRKASSSNSNSLLATANANALTGSFQVEVLQLASNSKLQTGNLAGQGNNQGGIADVATDFSGETLTQLNSANRLREALTEGSFFVNGQQITITSGSTLNSIFTDIQNATGATGALAYDPAKGGQTLTFSSLSAINLSSGSSNFLSVFKLDTAAYAAGSISSTDAVNGVRADLKLDNSAGATNLAQTVASGVLTLNGVAIAYNGANDSLNDLIQRINLSDAGVNANYSSLGGGKLVITQKTTGPQTTSFSDTGNLSQALGLSAPDSVIAGNAAQIKIDGGSTQYFTRNSGIQAAGLEGVTLDLREANPGNPFTVTVNADSEAAVGQVQGFVDQFNAVVSRINELTAYNPSTKARGTLLSDFTVNNVKDRLFKLVFGTVTGLTQGNERGTLSELGISTGAIGSVAGTTTSLQLDASKLTQALQDTPTRVAQIFGATATSNGSAGIMSQFKTYLDGLSNATGTFNQKQKVVSGQIDLIDSRIENLNKRLTSRQKILEQQFSSMEKILSRLQTQQSALSNLITQLSAK